MVAARIDDLAEIEAELRLYHLGAEIDVLAKDGLAIVKPTSHSDVLLACAGEHKGHGPLRGFLYAVAQIPRVSVPKRRGCFSTIAADEHPPVLEALPPDLECVGHVGKTVFRVLLEMGGKIVSRRFECRLRLR